MECGQQGQGQTDLLPKYRYSLGKRSPGTVEGLAPIAYREMLKRASAKPYALVNPSGALREEWRELVRFKTVDGNYKRWAPEQTLSRQKGGRWKSTASFVRPETAGNWYAFQNGKYVPTAGAAWSYFAQYLGWLCLAADDGGMGLPQEQVHTLAHLTNCQYLEQYIDWRKARSDDKVNGGLITFLKKVTSFCHPDTGYLTQSWRVFGGPSKTTPEAWRALCVGAYKDIRAKLNDFTESKSRDPFEPIQAILRLPNPLDGIADAVKRMDANRPSTGGLSEAIWARDRLLLTLLASNPLRLKNVQLLTYKVNGTGHLVNDNGVWRICIPKEEFKNESGAAKDRDYRMPIREELWPHIERYLAIYRPMFGDAKSSFLFVSGLRPSKAWVSLGRHFAALTKRYFFGCPGVGPHAMRHIVATAILKVRPNDFATAAWALHDKVETVEKNYSHLRSDDAKRWLDPAMSSPFSRM